LATLGQVIDIFKTGTTSGGGAPVAAAAAGPSSPAQASVTEAETTNDHLESVVEDNKKQQGLLKQQGIKIAPATIKEENKGVESAMLSALRTALFEFYMYSATDRSTLLSAMKAGGVSDPRVVAPYFAGKSLEGGSTTAAVAGLATGEAKPNATGGTVTGIANGMAVVASHGEGLASVGRGERIMPAGAGGVGGVNVTVNGIGGQDLQRLIEGKVVDGIREFKRRQRLYRCPRSRLLTPTSRRSPRQGTRRATSTRSSGRKGRFHSPSRSRARSNAGASCFHMRSRCM
jgi:hypothetical protein